MPAMCGRYVSPRDADIEGVWHIGARHNRYPDYSGMLRFNAAPTQLLPIVRQDPAAGLELLSMRWGLVPSWAKDPGIGAKMINARGETVAEKPAFRAAFKRRRCLVPMMGFYEWRKTPAGKVPYYIRLLNAELFGAAGLYEYWPGKDGTESIESFAIITAEPNEMMASLHGRMPVILAEGDHAAWLDLKNERTDDLQQLLRPYPSDEMTAYPVSKRVNSPKNDDSELIEPATT